MTIIPYILFVSIFFLDFLALDLGILPKQATWFPELLSGLVLIATVTHLALRKSIVIHPKYVLLFVVFIIQLIAGAILNSVEPGTIFAGIRYYFKYAPLFLLPAVYIYSDAQILKQLKFLLALAFVQFPIVLYQYFFYKAPGHQTLDLDNVSGTLPTTSVLSIYLISVIVILLGFYFKQKLKFMHFFVLTLFLFIPTTLNDTKGTVILLPIAIFVVALTARMFRENARQLIPVLAIIPLLFGAFFFVYSALFVEEGLRNNDLTTFFTDPERGIKSYLYTGEAAALDAESILRDRQVVVGEKSDRDIDQGKIRRLDAVILPFRVLSTDPSKLLLGLGLGNASESAIGKFSGKYEDILAMNSTQVELAYMVWEIGILGLLIFLLFFYFIYKDAKALARRNTLPGIIATGWTGIVVVIVLSLLYKNIMVFNVVGFLFWYFSGYVVAKNLLIDSSKQQNLASPAMI